jgi:putative proteasome-type protease
MVSAAILWKNLVARISQYFLWLLFSSAGLHTQTTFQGVHNLTYCAAISVDAGTVLVSDSRTNAGVDQVSTYSKMHRLLSDGERMMTLLSAGNLATSQAVVRQVRKDINAGAKKNLKSVATLADAADYIAAISMAEQRKFKNKTEQIFNPEVSLILAGQIKGSPPQIFLVYPEGNYIRASRRSPFLQIGELKYGKPILDRIVESGMGLETAAQCALVSMDSTMRSNLTVGPPVELLMYEADSFSAGTHLILDEDDPYMKALKDAWHSELKTAFDHLPKLPPPENPMRIIDGSADQ